MWSTARLSPGAAEAPGNSWENFMQFPLSNLWTRSWGDWLRAAAGISAEVHTGPINREFPCGSVPRVLVEDMGREGGLRTLRRFLIRGGGPNPGDCEVLNRTLRWVGVGTLKLSGDEPGPVENIPTV